MLVDGPPRTISPHSTTSSSTESLGSPHSAVSSPGSVAVMTPSEAREEVVTEVVTEVVYPSDGGLISGLVPATDPVRGDSNLSAASTASGSTLSHLSLPVTPATPSLAKGATLRSGELPEMPSEVSCL